MPRSAPRSRATLTVLLVAATLLATGCLPSATEGRAGAESRDIDGTSASPSDGVVGRWALASTDPAVRWVPGPRVVLVVEGDGRATHDELCGSPGGSLAAAEDGTFTAVLGSQEDVGCGEGVEEARSAYLSLVEAATDWAVSGDDLVLTGPDGTVRYRRDAGVEPRDVRWVVETFDEDDVERRRRWEGTAPSFRLARDGVLSVHTGCRVLTGSWTTPERGVVLGDLPPLDVDDGCDVLELDAERRVLAVLDGRFVFDVDAGAQRFDVATNDDGTRGLGVTAMYFDVDEPACCAVPSHDRRAEEVCEGIGWPDGVDLLPGDLPPGLTLLPVGGDERPVSRDGRLFRASVEVDGREVGFTNARYGSPYLDVCVPSDADVVAALVADLPDPASHVALPRDGTVLVAHAPRGVTDPPSDTVVGELVDRDGCVLLRTGDGRTDAVVWPAGAFLGSTAPLTVRLDVLDPEARIVAGDRIVTTGRRAPASSLDVDVPAACVAGDGDVLVVDRAARIELPS